MTFIKLDQADLDFLRRELSNGGLKIVVVLLVRWQIIFVGSDLMFNLAVHSFLVLTYFLSGTLAIKLRTSRS